MPTESCPICGHRLPREFLSTHLMRAHPDNAGGKPDTAAAAPPSGAYQGDLATGLAPPDRADTTTPPELGRVDPPAGPVPAEATSPQPPPPPPPPAEPAASEVRDTAVEAGASAAPPSPEAPPVEAASAPSSPTGSSSVPTTKELHAWLGKHRHRTRRSTEWAQNWCDGFSPSRRVR